MYTRNADGRALEHYAGNGIGLNLRVSFYNLHTRSAGYEPHSLFQVNIPQRTSRRLRIQGLLWWSRCDVKVDLLAFPTFAPKRSFPILSSNILVKFWRLFSHWVRYDDPFACFASVPSFSRQAPLCPHQENSIYPGVGNSPARGSCRHSSHGERLVLTEFKLRLHDEARYVAM